MNQSLRVIDCAQPSQPGTAVNWQLCIICQQDAPSQALVCPSLAKKRLSGDGYVTLEKDLLGFESIGHLPSHIALRAWVMAVVLPIRYAQTVPAGTSPVAML